MENSQQNDEWSCSTDDWNYIEQSSANKNSNLQKLNSTKNSDLPLNSYPVPDSNNGISQSLVNLNRPTHNFNNGIENGQHKYSVINHNWFDKSENQLDQMSNVQHIFVNQDIDNTKCDNIVETEENFWADVENREILPPESFQNDSLQVAMNNLQISDEVSILTISQFLSKLIVFEKTKQNTDKILIYTNN